MKPKKFKGFANENERRAAELALAEADAAAAKAIADRARVDSYKVLFEHVTPEDELTPMNVARLIEALQKCPPASLVRLEGCDCYGDAGGVVLSRGRVLIQRADGEEHA